MHSRDTLLLLLIVVAIVCIEGAQHKRTKRHNFAKVSATLNDGTHVGKYKE